MEWGLVWLVGYVFGMLYVATVLEMNSASDTGSFKRLVESGVPANIVASVGTAMSLLWPATIVWGMYLISRDKS